MKKKKPRFEELITQGRTKVRDEYIESNVVEGPRGPLGDKGLSSSSTNRDPKSGKGGDVGELHRKRRIRQREGVPSESLQVIDSFDNARIEGDHQLSLTLVKVSEVDGGSARGPSGAEGSKEGFLESIPVVAVEP